MLCCVNWSITTNIFVKTTWDKVSTHVLFYVDNKGYNEEEVVVDFFFVFESMPYTCHI